MRFVLSFAGHRAHGASARRRPAHKRKSSRADIPGVDPARHGWVLRTLDDGTAVREDGQLVGVEQALEQVWVGSHRTELFKARPELREVERARLALVNLDGVPPAQRDVRGPAALEVDELPRS